MSKVSDRLNALEQLVTENEAKLRKKASFTKVLYLLCVLTVFGYTIFMVWKIREWTSPEVTSEILVGMISQQTSQARERATRHLKENSEIIASSVVQQSIEAIPQTEETIMGVMDNLIDYVANQIELVLIPEFTLALKKNSSDLHEHYKEFNDEEKMQGLSLILVELLENEMDKYINDKLIEEIFELKKQISSLNKPMHELTRKERAQKRVLSNWLYLTEHHDIGDSVVLDFIVRIKSEFNSILEIHDEKQDIENIGFSTAQDL